MSWLLQILRRNPTLLKIAKDQAEEELWKKFWKEKYDSGKKRVPNSNPQSRKRYPTISANVAFKRDPSFKSLVKKEFENYKSKPKEKSAPKRDYSSIMDRVNLLHEDPNNLKHYSGGTVSDLLDLCGTSSILGEISKDDSLKIKIWSDIIGNIGEYVVRIVSDSISQERTVRLKGGKPLSISNDGFYLKKSKSGLGFSIFSSQVEEAKKRGFKRIKTTAARALKSEGYDYDLVGYYVWPIFGYDSELKDWMMYPKNRSKKKEVLEWKKKLKEENLPFTLQGLYSISGGREWWKENGSDIFCTFDLSEGSKSMEILEKYKEKKKGGKKASRPKGKDWVDAPDVDLSEDQLKEIFVATVSSL